MYWIQEAALAFIENTERCSISEGKNGHKQNSVMLYKDAYLQ